MNEDHRPLWPGVRSELRLLIEKQQSTITALESKIARQRHELAALNEVLHRKNLELDALHYVWCDGSCTSGVHRYGEHPPLTEELIAAAKLAVARMEKKLANLDEDKGEPHA